MPGIDLVQGMTSKLMKKRNLRRADDENNPMKPTLDRMKRKKRKELGADDKDKIVQSSCSAWATRFERGQRSSESRRTGDREGEAAATWSEDYLNNEL